MTTKKKENTRPERHNFGTSRRSTQVHSRDVHSSVPDTQSNHCVPDTQSNRNIDKNQGSKHFNDTPGHRNLVGGTHLYCAASVPLSSPCTARIRERGDAFVGYTERQGEWMCLMLR